MAILSFLWFSAKRLRSRLGLTALFTLSVALTVGLMVCIPIFANAVSRRMMAEEMNQRTRSRSRAAFSVRYFAWPTPSRPMTIADAAYARDWLGDLLRREIGLPLRSVYMHLESPRCQLRSRTDDPRFGQRDLAAVRVTIVESIASHLDTVEGAPLGQFSDPAMLSAWVEQAFADELALQLGDTFELSPEFGGGPEGIAVRIVGFFRAANPSESYWSWDTTVIFSGALLTTFEQYERFIYPAMTEKIGFASWYYVLDDSQMDLRDAPRHIAGLQRIARQVEEYLPGGQMNDGPVMELSTGQRRKTALTLILLGFGLPLVGILICFVASLSAMLVQFQSREIAMLVSRGTSRGQVLGLMAQETVLILLIGCPLGLLLGVVSAWLLGYSFSFLHFSIREPLQVNLVGLDGRLLALAVLLSLLTRLLPAWVATRLTVLVQERAVARWRNTLGLTRSLLLVLLAVVTVYGYRQLALRGTLGLVSWLPGDPSHDPLLLLAPSLFLFAAPLAMVELMMVLVRPLAWIGRWLRGPGAYLGMLNLAREGRHYRLPVYMLVLSLSLGVFYASLARSADAWLTDRRRYEFGSDVTFDLYPDPEQDITAGPDTRPRSALQGARDAVENPALIPLSEYEGIPGVRQAMRLGDLAAITQLDDQVELRLLAIERLAFPNVAYFRDDYAEQTLGQLMNALGHVPNGILIPTVLAQRLQLAEGDRLNLSVAFEPEAQESHVWRQQIEFVVAGMFDFFPTMEPDQSLAAVANLDYLEAETGGALPYGLWLRLDPGAKGETVRQQVIRLRVAPYHWRDLQATEERDRNRLERVGIFGLISLCFLGSALISMLGMAVFNVAMTVQRSTRLAVLRALGMGRGGLLRSVALEHLLVLLYGLLAGLGVGALAARLYVPFFPLTDTPRVPVPPFLPAIDWPSSVVLALTLGAAALLVEMFVLLHVARAKLYEMLRMGARE